MPMDDGTPATGAPLPPPPPPAQPDAKPDAKARGTVDLDGVIKDHGSRLARVEATLGKPAAVEAPKAAPAAAARRSGPVIGRSRRAS